MPDSPGRRSDDSRLPFLILGVRNDGLIWCLDCCDVGEPILAGDEEAEFTTCIECHRPLRHADAFGTLHEENWGAMTERERNGA